MKKIYKLLVLLFITSALTVSCDYDESEYDSLFKDYTGTSTYYLQFSDASRSLQSSVDIDGNIVDIVTTVDVVLLGPPQSQDVVVDLVINPSSTIQPNMYTLSSNSVTIPAGETSGSVTLTTNTAEMPEEETLILVIDLDAGENTATAGTTLSYDLYRIKFCPLENGVVDLEGSYGVTENYSDYENAFTAVENGGKLDVTGLSEDFINGFWGEAVVAGGTFKMEATGNGNLIIPRQYIYTTVYDGAEYDYEIEGSGTWNNCGDTPVLTFTYDIFYPGDSRGLAETYSSYLPNPYLGGVYTKN